MLFRVTEHCDYENNMFIATKRENKPTENSFANNECFICYEVALKDETQTIRLNNQTDFIKLCQCNGWIHKKCLNDWFQQAHTCPICRTNIQRRPPFLSIFSEKILIIVFPLTIIKHMYRLIKYFAILGLLCFTYDLYVTIIGFETFEDSHYFITRYRNSTILYETAIVNQENIN